MMARLRICPITVTCGLLAHVVFSLPPFITTPLCERTEGSQISASHTFTSMPGDPVVWYRQGTTEIGRCRPGISCNNVSDYTLTYNNSGLTYTLQILHANATLHEGDLAIRDLFGANSVELLSIQPNLMGVDVDCGSTTGTDPSPGSVTISCRTECVDSDIVLSLELQNSSYTGQHTTTCGSGGKQYLTTATLDNNLNLAGDKKLCYKIEYGNCSYLQPTPACVTVSFPEPHTTSGPTESHTTSGPTELPTTTPVRTEPPTTASTGTPPNECCDSPPCCDKILKIVFLAIACLLLLLHVGFIVAVRCAEKKKELKGTSRCPAWVCPVLLATGIVIALVAIVVLAVSFGYDDDQCICRALLITGIAFAVISIVICIVVVVLIVCLKKSNHAAENRNNSSDVALKVSPSSVS